MNKNMNSQISLISIIDDEWCLLILRDILFLKRTKFYEFKSSRENIDSDNLTNRLNILLSDGFIKVLNPRKDYKDIQYIATSKGLSTLSILIELYLFSIKSIKTEMFSEIDLDFKKEVLQDSSLFKEKIANEYNSFVQQIQRPIIN
tara:strand:- start:76 stop:513 length:438 start_codon:yes stop_codon:yes gene_type:complete